LEFLVSFGYSTFSFLFHYDIMAEIENMGCCARFKFGNCRDYVV
jgi:hypothetical protein